MVDVTASAEDYGVHTGKCTYITLCSFVSEPDGNIHRAWKGKQECHLEFLLPPDVAQMPTGMTVTPYNSILYSLRAQEPESSSDDIPICHEKARWMTSRLLVASNKLLPDPPQACLITGRTALFTVCGTHFTQNCQQAWVSRYPGPCCSRV